MAETKISQNGQVVIPFGIRQKAGIRPGTEFEVYDDGKGNIVLVQRKAEEIKKRIESVKKGIK